jgi:hypothetical protein
VHTAQSTFFSLFSEFFEKCLFIAVAELGMLQVKDIYEQVKLTSNVKREMKLNGIDGIEINNVEMLRLIAIELHSIITWQSITVHSKSLLLDQ